LNSKLFFYAVKMFYGGGGLGETGIRMKHTFFENFPMPKFTQEKQREIKKLVQNPIEQNLKNVDTILYKAFELEKEEVDFIESQ